MEISILEKEANKLRLQIAIAESDYAEDFKSELKKVSKQLNVPGFRKGKVPTQMAKKMVGDSVKGDVINHIVLEKIEEVIKEQEVRQLMAPLPADENDEQFKLADPTFVFDIALVPTEEFDFDVKKSSFTQYEAEVSDDEVDELLEDLLGKAGGIAEVDTIDEASMVYGHLKELDGDLPKEGGIELTDNFLALRAVTNEEEREKLIGQEKDSVVIFSPYNAFDGNMTELRYFLGLEKEDDLEQYKDVDFSFQITKIEGRKQAELGQEFYDKVFGEGTVTSEEEAKAKLREQLEGRNKNLSNIIFAQDFYKEVDEKYVPQLGLDSDLIIASHEFNTDKKIPETEDKDLIIQGLKIDLHTKEWAKRLEVEISYEELFDFVMDEVRSQFASFGWHNAPDDIIEEQAKARIVDGGTSYLNRIEMNLIRNHIVEKVKPELDITTEIVTYEELQKKMEAYYVTQDETEVTEEEGDEA